MIEKTSSELFITKKFLLPRKNRKEAIPGGMCA